MDGGTVDEQKVITIAHPEHSSGELKMSVELVQRLVKVKIKHHDRLTDTKAKLYSPLPSSCILIVQFKNIIQQ